MNPTSKEWHCMHNSQGRLHNLEDRNIVKATKACYERTRTDIMRRGVTYGWINHLYEKAWECRKKELSYMIYQILSKITQARKMPLLSKCAAKARYRCKWKRVDFPWEQGGIEWPKSASQWITQWSEERYLILRKSMDWKEYYKEDMKEVFHNVEMLVNDNGTPRLVCSRKMGSG